MKTTTIAKWSVAAFALTAFTPVLATDVQAQTEAQQVPIQVFKDGTTELSQMANYTEKTVSVSPATNGYTVTMTFNQGGFVNDFDVNGTDTLLVEHNTESNIKKYTFHVAEVPTTVTAVVDLTVNVPGVISYEKVYDVQIKVGDKAISFEPKEYPFTDIENASQKEAIIELYKADIFKGAEKFNPANSLKRQQFALMLQRAYTFTDPVTTSFTDIGTYAEETQIAIRSLNHAGVINGKTATTFAPNDEVTRKQAALMIYRLLKNQFGYVDQVSNPQGKFSDVTGEETQAVAELNHLGIMTGFEGKFNPGQKLTRNQMAKVLKQTIAYTDNVK